MLNTTAGQLFVNDALPEELRDYHRTLDKKALSGLLQQVARQHPDKYKDITHKLNQIGLSASQEHGGMSFGVSHLKKSEAATKIHNRIRTKLRSILADDTLSDKERANQIILTTSREGVNQEKEVLEEAKLKGNPLAMQVVSGTRGKPMNLVSLLGSDMLYTDHRDEVIPIPVLRSYSEGLSPEEYWAGTYGARRGIIATRLATQESGYLSKQLNQASHRLVVMDEDGPEDQQVRGLIADVDDTDNEGALLAKDTGPYRRNTALTPKMLSHLERMGHKRILVRSSIIGGSPEGGVYARDVGVREHGSLPGRGEQVGLQAAQALSEPLSQSMLSAKHSGGVAGKEKAVGGFQYINQLIQTPKSMLDGATHAQKDGVIQTIEEAPAGGHYVYIGGERHYVSAKHDLKVKKGDTIEAGDVLSDGIPNPALITQYKGVGEGRKYFVDTYRKALKDSGITGHRRNIELLARGLINHVKLTEETDEHAPDDVVAYSTLEHTYKPRENHQILDPKKAVGQYLERPVLHYTIGTQIKPSMLQNLNEFGVKSVTVHKDPAPFEPVMVRGMYQMQYDPDWMTQMYGSGLKHSLLNSAARGATSEERGTSFVPSLAIGTDFGDDPTRAVIAPKAGYPVPKMAAIDPSIMPEKDAFDTAYAPLLTTGLGGVAGLFSGYNKNPGVDAQGNQKSRWRNMAMHGLAGAGLGYGAGKLMQVGTNAVNNYNQDIAQQNHFQTQADSLTDRFNKAREKLEARQTEVLAKQEALVNNFNKSTATQYTDPTQIPDTIKQHIDPGVLALLEQYGPVNKWARNQGLEQLTLGSLLSTPPEAMKKFLTEVNQPYDVWNEALKPIAPGLVADQGINMADNVVARQAAKLWGTRAITQPTSLMGKFINTAFTKPVLGMMPGASLVGVGTKSLGAGRMGLAGLGASTVYNGGKELMDLAGLLPESMGGNGLGRLGFDMDSFDQRLAYDVDRRGALGTLWGADQGLLPLAGKNWLNKTVGNPEPVDYSNAVSLSGLNFRGIDSPLKSLYWLARTIPDPINAAYNKLPKGSMLQRNLANAHAFYNRPTSEHFNVSNWDNDPNLKRMQNWYDRLGATESKHKRIPVAPNQNTPVDISALSRKHNIPEAVLATIYSNQGNNSAQVATRQPENLY